MKVHHVTDRILFMEALARGTRFRRFLHHPFKYLFAQIIRHFINRFFPNGIRVQTRLFWNEKFSVALPAGTDIYLTGGKADDSEIRLAKYIIRTLKDGNHFLDIGGHYGYFSRLALLCTGKNGKVIALEPSLKTFALLKKNLSGNTNAISINALAGENSSEHEFFEFPVLYSEYNTRFPGQFAKDPWYGKNNMQSYLVSGTTIDNVCLEYKLQPTFIKIDTEGSELEVIKGARETLVNFPGLLISMEYVSARRGNENHKQASEILRQYGFQPFFIDAQGQLQPCPDIEKHLLELNAESDNIIFQRSPDL